jgi:succinylglutamate desuccinylase
MREEAKGLREKEIIDKVKQIETMLMLKTVYDQTKNEFKGNMAKELQDAFSLKEGELMKKNGNTPKKAFKSRGRRKRVLAYAKR